MTSLKDNLHSNRLFQRPFKCSFLWFHPIRTTGIAFTSWMASELEYSARSISATTMNKITVFIIPPVVHDVLTDVVSSSRTPSRIFYLKAWMDDERHMILSSRWRINLRWIIILWLRKAGWCLPDRSLTRWTLSSREMEDSERQVVQDRPCVGASSDLNMDTLLAVSWGWARGESWQYLCMITCSGCCIHVPWLVWLFCHVV